MSEVNGFMALDPGSGITLDEFEESLSGLMPGSNYTRNGGI